MFQLNFTFGWLLRIYTLRSVKHLGDFVSTHTKCFEALGKAIQRT